MNKYLKGFIKNLRNPAVSIFSIIDNESKIDKKAKLYPFVKSINSNVGCYSYINKRTNIVYSKIGKFCSIAPDCHIGLGIHTINNLSTSPIFTEKKNATKQTWTNKLTFTPYKEINVGNDVWIGIRTIIMGGVSIGDGAVIAAGSIVTKDVPPYAIVAGIPAKIIKYRFSQEIINILEKIKWWDLPEETLKRNLSLFQSNDITIDKLNSLIL